MRFLAFDAPVGDPKFREIIACNVCNRDGQQEHLRQMCGLTGAMLDWDFANTLAQPTNDKALAAARQLAQQPHGFYTLTGRPGVGKTRLLAVLVNEARRTGRTAVYTTTSELLDHLRAAYAPNVAVTFDGLLDRITSCTVLALDEVDRYSPTPWAEEKFFQLIERRNRDSDRCLTAFATNAKLESLPEYVVSRMSARGNQVFTLTGPDLRRL